jgi:hypothetical protein
MSGRTPQRGILGRALDARAVRIGLAATGALVSLLLIPDLWGFAPEPFRSRPVAAACLAVAAVASLGGWWVGRRPASPLGGALDALDRLSQRWLAGRLGAALVGAWALLLVVWAPSYLVRPWFRDADAFASLALGWDRGVLPYRDVVAYNFPGHIYLHWALGKVFGWGRTAPLHAVDLALFVALGAAVGAWSRKRLGGPLPGLAAVAALTFDYLSWHYMMIPERDWQAAALAAVGLMAADGWGGGRGAAAAGAAFGLALATRPHAVLLLPALAAALAGGPGAGATGRRWARSALIAAGACAATFALLMLPLVAQGLVDDWVHALRLTAPGGAYAPPTSRGAAVRFVENLTLGGTGWLLAACVLAAGGRLGTPSRVAAMLGLALIGSVAWRALHPVDHEYLALPRHLFTGLAMVVPARAALAAGGLRPGPRLALFVLVLSLAMPSPPATLEAGASLDAVLALARGGSAERRPPGCRVGFRCEPPEACPYSWRDYNAVLDYLRRETPPDAPVANLLRQFPFPSVNGPAGRVDPFRVESGLCWMVLVDQDLDETFARQLDTAADSTLVVWVPNERPHPRLRLPRLVEIVRARFEPLGRFGAIEVWHRRASRGPRPAAAGGLE